MSGFKLLVIRPLVDCDKRFLKNLKEGEIYKFYQNYMFTANDGKEILPLNSNPIARICNPCPQRNYKSLKSKKPNLTIRLLHCSGKISNKIKYFSFISSDKK